MLLWNGPVSFARNLFDTLGVPYDRLSEMSQTARHLWQPLLMLILSRTKILVAKLRALCGNESIEEHSASSRKRAGAHREP
jgi:hypothetical protein